MIKKFSLLILGVSLFAITQIKAQKTDTIEIRKGSSFYYQGKRLELKQLGELMKDNIEASAALKKAKANVLPTTIFSALGGAFMGYAVGSAISGDKFDWTIFGIGGGLVVVAIPFSVASAKHAKTAVELYNKKPYSSSLKPALMLGFMPNGAGLKMKF